MSCPFLNDDAQWIWVPEFDDTVDPGQFVLFRKTFSLEDIPQDEILLHVSADTRYRLYINGERLSFGPCKSYLTRWYYETVNIAPFLRAGGNVLSARVLRFSPTNSAGSSMARSPVPGLILWCKIGNQELHTNKTWKAMKDNATNLVSVSEWDFRLGPPFLDLSEKVYAEQKQENWTKFDFDEGAWVEAEIRSVKRKMSPMLDPRRLTPRPIPHLPEVSERFDGVVKCSDGTNIEDWKRLLRDDRPIKLAAGSISVVEIESSVLTTGFLELNFVVDGTGDAPEIQILCAESYENDMDKGQARSKDDRTNFRTGKLYGPKDTYFCNTSLPKNHYEPFWWRTFRYIRISVSCPPTSSLTFNSITYRSTHYPLPIITSISGTELVDKLYSTSVNTLLNCMHETYEDCPYYEQSQFAMDTRSQLLFSYTLSHSDLLARKTIHEFYASRRDDGLLETHFPNPGRGMNIPQFSLYWIFMLQDHMSHFHDLALVKKYIGTADGILDHFAGRLNEQGLVGKFEVEGTWAFVDWVGEWFTPAKGFSSMGVPKAYYEKGAATVNSLVYALALKSAADMCVEVGRKDTAAEYLERAGSVIRAVNEHCYDDTNGIYLDGPSAAGQHSQHVQIFAVLAEAVNADAAQTLMRRTIREREQLRMAKASFAMSFYLFRAVSKAGIYEEVWDELLSPWKKMLDQNLTTWAESESMVRSDCHGWSATPMYEITREVVGVKSRWNETKIIPRVDLVNEIKGSFVVAGGETVDVSWGESKQVKVKASKDMEVELVLRDTSIQARLLRGEEQCFGWR